MGEGEVDGRLLVWIKHITNSSPFSRLLTFILILKSWGCWVHLDYRVSSGPFFDHEF